MCVKSASSMLGREVTAQLVSAVLPQPDYCNEVLAGRPPSALATGTACRRSSGPRAGATRPHISNPARTTLASNPDSNPIKAIFAGSQRPDRTLAEVTCQGSSRSQPTFPLRPLCARHTAVILSSRQRGSDSGTGPSPSLPLVPGMFCRQN